MIKILLFEDNVELCNGLSLLLKSIDEYQVNAYNDLNDLDNVVKAHHPDVVLMDIGFPAGNGIDAVRRIKSVNRKIKVIMLTGMYDDRHIFDSLRAGADGYLLKKTPPAKLLDAVREVYDGGAPMTPSIARRVLESFSSTTSQGQIADNLSVREREVLKLLVSGMSYKLVAYEMNISIDTVRSHIRNIYDKLQVNSKSEAVAKAIINQMV